MSAIVLTKENFEREVMESSSPVLIDFWAPWCGPCRMVSLIIEEIAQEAAYKKICKVNVDEQPELAEKFQIMSIPTLMVVKNGKITKKSTGAIPKQAVLALFD